MPPLILLKASGYTTGPWLDQSPNGNNATLENGTASKNSIGNGIVLDGQTSWTFPNINLGEQWTANIWYKNISLNGGMIVTQIFDGNAINMAIGDTIQNNSVSSGHFNGGWVLDSTYYNLTPSLWTNIQIVSDGTNFMTYIDGILVSTSPGGPGVSGTSPYTIGRRWNTNQFIIGEIGELRIYNTPLTQAQVTADYEESFATFNAPPPVATSIVLSGSQIVYSATNVTLTATVFDQYSQPFTIDTLYITGNDETTYSSINNNGIFTFTVSNPNLVTVV